MLAPQLKPTIDTEMLYLIRSGDFGTCIKAPWFLQHSYHGCSIFMFILMESCSTPVELWYVVHYI